MVLKQCGHVITVNCYANTKQVSRCYSRFVVDLNKQYCFKFDKTVIRIKEWIMQEYAFYIKIKLYKDEHTSNYKTDSCLQR